MKHFKYLDTVKAIAQGDWGKKFETTEQAQLDLLKNVDLAGACLLSITSKIDHLLFVLAQCSLSEMAATARNESFAIVEKFIASRSKTHGPCPDIVRRYLVTKMHEQVGRQFLIDSIPPRLYEPEPPPKGTRARREYDKWMRRKITKKP